MYICLDAHSDAKFGFCVRKPSLSSLVYHLASMAIRAALHTFGVSNIRSLIVHFAWVFVLRRAFDDFDTYEALYSAASESIASASFEALEHFTIKYEWKERGVQKTRDRKLSARHLLTHTRLNDEPTDPATKAQQEVMKRLTFDAVAAGANVMTSFATASFAKALGTALPAGSAVTLQDLSKASRHIIDNHFHNQFRSKRRRHRVFW